MKKKIAALFLVFSMLLSLTGAFSANDSEIEEPTYIVCGRDSNGIFQPHTYVNGLCKYCNAPYYDGSVATSFERGTGTLQDPFIIETAAQLAYLASMNVNNMSVYFELANDIYLNDIAYFTRDNGGYGYFNGVSDPAKVNVFRGIGSYLPFMGHFDGKGHTIYGLYTTGGYGAGLFNSAFGATIKNVTVSDSLIAHSSNKAGAVVGDATKTQIINCHNNNTTVIGTYSVGGVIGESYNDRQTGSITGCTSNGKVVSNGDEWFTNCAYTGGVVGFITCVSTADFVIKECANYGPVTGSAGYGIGGVIGGARMIDDTSKITVQDCFNTGDVTSSKEWAGGVIGIIKKDSAANTVAIARCYNKGKVNATEGACGILSWITNGNNVTVTECYNAGVLSSSNGTNNTTSTTQAIIGALDGGLTYTATRCYYHENSNVTSETKATRLTDAQMKTQSSFSGYNFNTNWEMNVCNGQLYPQLKMFKCSHSYTTFENYNVRVLRPATCQEQGLRYITCISCGNTIYSGIYYKEHVWEYKKTVQVSCDVYSRDVYVCSLCGELDYVQGSIPPRRHEGDESVVFPPTCTVSGSSYTICSICGSPFSIVELPKLNHEWSEFITINPTCINDGKQFRTCSLCDVEEVIEEYSALGHDVDAKGFCTRENCEYCEYILGDINNDGTVDDMDAMTLERYLAHWIGYEVHPYASDIDSDGIIDDMDEMILTRFLAGWSLSYPIGVFTNNGK